MLLFAHDDLLEERIARLRRNPVHIHKLLENIGGLGSDGSHIQQQRHSRLSVTRSGVGSVEQTEAFVGAVLPDVVAQYGLPLRA